MKLWHNLKCNFIKTCFKIHFKTMTQSVGIRCALKGQSLYLHFIQLLLLVSSMTQARCESLKPCTRLFWLREVRGNNYLPKVVVVCLWHRCGGFWCGVSCYLLPQIEKMWYFDINVKQEKQMPEWMLSSQMSKDFERQKIWFRTNTHIWWYS